MAKDPVKRKHFVDSAVKFIQNQNSDGLNLEWEYPGKKKCCTGDKTSALSNNSLCSLSSHKIRQIFEQVPFCL